MYAARFDPSGTRLFVVRDRELQIFDPISTQPTEPLLKIPLEAGSNLAFPILAFSPSGQQLAVALNGKVTFFDVTDGK